MDIAHFVWAVEQETNQRWSVEEEEHMNNVICVNSGRKAPLETAKQAS